MRKTNIYLGIISVLALLFSITAFAENGPSGDSGMLSAREMRAAIKSGGSFTSQSNVLNGGTQVRYGGDEKARSAPITNANTINNLNTKGHSGGPGGTVILSGAMVSGIVSKAMSSPQGSMNRAVNALQSTSSAIAQQLNLPIGGQSGFKSQTSVGGVNVPAYSSQLPMDKNKAAKADAWLAAGGNKAKGLSGSTSTVTTGPNSLAGTEAGDFLGIEPGTPATSAGIKTNASAGANSQDLNKNTFFSKNASPTVAGTAPNSTYKPSTNRVFSSGVNFNEPLSFK